MNDETKASDTGALDPQYVEFVDTTAQLLYCAGWPRNRVYTHAEQLWTLRTEWLKGKEKP